MTQEQKALLKPFGNVFHEIAQQILAMSDDDLAKLLKAADATSTTNCWCCSFEAAQFLKKEIRIEVYQRKQRAEAEPVAELSDPQ